MTEPLNLNARRAALAESGAAMHPVQLGFDEAGDPHTWHFSTELPVDALALLNRGEMTEVLGLLLPATELAGFMEQHPTMQEVAEIVTAISGVTVGNLRAST